MLHLPLRELSLGQRTRCELVAVLLHNPSVLLLDEPTISLDIEVKRLCIFWPSVAGSTRRIWKAKVNGGYRFTFHTPAHRRSRRDGAPSPMVRPATSPSAPLGILSDQSLVGLGSQRSFA
ncbi:MAG: ATP-binding cassette domain-containing protein [Candidatus Bipolaricaulia bacterium]